SRELSKAVSAPILKCLQGAIDEATMAARYADARKLINSDETKKVLGPNVLKRLGEELQATIQEALKGLVADDIKARRWSAAVDKVDAAVKKGDADDAAVAVMLAAIRDGAATEIAALATKGVGSRDAVAMLRQVDALIKTVRWEIIEGEA